MKIQIGWGMSLLFQSLFQWIFGPVIKLWWWVVDYYDEMTNYPIEYRHKTYGEFWPYFKRVGDMGVWLGDLVVIRDEKYCITGMSKKPGDTEPIEFTPLKIPEMIAFFHRSHFEGLKVVAHYPLHKLEEIKKQLKLDFAATAVVAPGTSFK